MRTRTVSIVLALIVGTGLILPTPAHAQIRDRLKDAAEDAGVREAERQFERLLRDATAALSTTPSVSGRPRRRVRRRSSSTRTAR